MTDHLFSSIASILTAIVGVAILAVLVSKNAATSQVLSAGFGGFSQALGTAVSPVTGASSGLGASNFNLGFN